MHLCGCGFSSVPVCTSVRRVDTCVLSMLDSWVCAYAFVQL